MSHTCSHRWLPGGFCAFCSTPQIDYRPRKMDEPRPKIAPGANLGMMLAANELTPAPKSDWAFDQMVRTLRDSMRKVRR